MAVTPHLTQNLGPMATSMIAAACLVPRLPPGHAARPINTDEPCLSVGAHALSVLAAAPAQPERQITADER
jgi:hypothetical protein